MDALLSPVSTTYNKPADTEEPLFQEVVKKAAPAAPARQHFTASSADEALEVLRNEPYYETLVSVLRFLLADSAPVDIRQPSPLSAQLVQVLVTAIVPNYWALLREESAGGREAKKSKKRQHGGRADSDVDPLLACLRSVTGLSALAVRLRALLAEAKTGSAAKQDQPGNPAWQLRTLLEVLSELLAGDEAVAQVWAASTSGTDDDAKRRPLAQEFLNLVGGGKIVSLAAEAEALVKQEFSSEKLPPTWVANGKEYSLWLVRSIIRWASQDAKSEDLKVHGALLGKSLRLGYPDAVISALVSDLVLGSADVSEDALARLLEQLPPHEQKKILSGVLKFASETYFSSFSTDPTSVDAATVSAVAGLIRRVAGSSALLHEQLVSWLLTNPAVGLGGGIGVRRAAMAVVAENRKGLSDILEKSMAEFGDQLFIKHSPIIQQEAKAQVLLLSAGYISREAPRSLASLLRSRAYLDAVSNRLSASQNRARFLGMVVGEALSSLIDNSKQKLDFHMEEMGSEEAKWYKALVRVSDTVGSLESLRKRTPSTEGNSSSAKQTKPPPPKTSAKPVRRQPVQPKTTGFVIEELDDDEEDGEGDRDGDLVAYGKPDSDAEDSDDDPTLIRRDKPKAPVYIRDLIAYFRDTENYDKQRLALTTAPVLIRRKANFGTEVQQHAQDLASILVGLQDTYDMDDFYQLRLQGMVALVVAQPKMVGSWYALTFFEGDYSLAQRASVLTALGLGARELAGFDSSEHASAAAFPSKQLPERVERLYVPSEGSQPGGRLPGASPLKPLTRGALDSIADSLTATFLGPIAAKAADEATGPDVLKLASFKSRLQQKNGGKAESSGAAKSKGTGTVTRTSTTTTKAAPKTTTNTAGQLLAAAFFFPLAARFQLALQSSAPRTRRGVLFEPSLLSLYLKTLAVVLHAAGPGALALPDMTAELWGLLLGSGVQAHCVGDVLVTHAVLFALLALLDVNEGRARELCRDLPREVVQTRDWVLQVLENTRGGGGGGGGGGDAANGQEGEIQMLAAGTYIRLTESMESYKNLLLGEMIG